MLPAELVAQAADAAELAARLQAQHAQRLRHDQPLLLVVRRRHALKHLQALQGGLAAGGLVRDHAPDGLVEDARRGAEVEGACRCLAKTLDGMGRHCCRRYGRAHLRESGCTGSSSAGRPGISLWKQSAGLSPFLQPTADAPAFSIRSDAKAWMGGRRTLGAEKLAGDVEVLAADDNDLLAVEQLLGHDAGQPAQQMALAINDDLRNDALASHRLGAGGALLGRAAIRFRRRDHAKEDLRQARMSTSWTSSGSTADVMRWEEGHLNDAS